MNYRHAFHAGNFADVFKHAVLARILIRLREKPTPFRVIDTHAGAGLYDLEGEEANKTGEWREGIVPLMQAELPPAARDFFEPYLSVVRAFNPDGALRRYPGSAVIAQALLRPSDRLTACELEPGALRTLRLKLQPDRRVKALGIDGWTALNAYVPPPERRGLVLIDPPFEQPGEFERLRDGFATAHRKWPTGVYLLWYPLKQPEDARALSSALIKRAIPRLLRIEWRTKPKPDQRLDAAGLLVANPPWRLDDELRSAGPVLDALLDAPLENRFTLDWLAADR